MYSVVLMAALSSNLATPDFGRRGGGGGGCCGCYGGCYGGGCWGGGYGGGWGGGCFGGFAYGGYPIMMGGCYGGGVIMGGQMGITGTGGTGGIGKQGTGGGGRKKTTGGDDESRLDNSSAEVVLVVSLPADARLLIDDQPTRSTGPTRVFVSPRLEGGRAYTYELKGEIQQEGRARNVSQSVKVEPGRTTYVSLTFPTREVVQGNR